MTARCVVVALAACGLPGALAGQAPVRADTAVPMPAIEVTATRSTEPLRDAPYAVSVLTEPVTVADLGLSLPAALAAIPGVMAQSRGTAARDESIAIRGFGARAAFGVRGMRVLLDGIPLTLPDGQSQLTNVNMRRIARVEVLRGAASALYGNATGGVISLESDRTVPDAARPEGRVGAGSDGLVTTDARLVTPLGGGAVLDVAAERTSATGYRDQSRYELWRANVTSHVPVGSGTVTWLADLGAFPEAQDPGALTAEEVAANPRQANPGYLTANAGKDVWQAQTGASLQYPLGQSGRLEAAAFAARRDLDNALPFTLINLGRWAYGGRLVTTLPFPQAHMILVTGADAQWLRDDRRNRAPADSALTRDQLETVREVGPFLQARFRPAPPVAIEAGARYDVVTFGVRDRLLDDGDASGTRAMRSPSGTLGLSLAVAEPLVVWGRVGTAFETPTTTELANTPDGDAGFNPALEPQRTTEVEGGVRVSHGVLHAAVTGFHDAVRDELIPFEVPSDPGRRYFRNAGSARHQGMEVEAGARWRAGAWIEATYTLSDLRFTDYATDSVRYDGNRIPGVPVHLGRIAGGLRAGPIAIESEVRAASHVFVDDANSATADARWVADVKVLANLRMGAAWIQPTAGVENLFDRHSVGSVAVNGAFGRYYEPAPGRTLYVALTVHR